MGYVQAIPVFIICGRLFDSSYQTHGSENLTVSRTENEKNTFCQRFQAATFKPTLGKYVPKSCLNTEIRVMWAFTFAKLWPGSTSFAPEYGSISIFDSNLTTLILLFFRLTHIRARHRERSGGRFYSLRNLCHVA